MDLKSPRALRNLYKIAVYSIFWVLGSMLYAIVELGILGETAVYPSTGAPYNFNYNLPTSMIFAFLFGALFGVIEITVLQSWLKRKTFVFKLLAKSGIFVSLIILMMFLIGLVLNKLSMNLPLFHPKVLESSTGFFQSFAFWSIIIYIIPIMIVTQFFVEVSDSMGKSLLLNFITGRYHTPSVERRIFMFLDLKNSTPMAESLGHVHYFRLINTFFSDMSDPILDSWGEIYQYVGDEIVVTWPWNRGVAEANCVECFYRIVEKIKAREEFYQEHFGLIPEFRASIHGGDVSLGEIGTLKKDILFTGDILNATSRILSMCKEFEASLLVSASVVDGMRNWSDAYQATSAGKCTLKGKKEKIELYHILPKPGK